MRLGLHVRISGGHAKAVERSRSLGCAAMQIFSSNPRSYRPSKIDVPALDTFADMRRDAGIEACVIHTPYLINLASEDPKVYNGSIALLKGDVAVAGAGRMQYVNTHLGSYGTRDRSAGFAAICTALESVLEEIAPNVVLVLENSAGAGSLAGGTIDELGQFVRAVDHPQLGVCLDTAHAWAAGYEINSKVGVDRFIEEAKSKIGLDRIAMFHFNDTEVPLGGNRDRHWHIGEGKIGFEGFRALLAHAELREKTAILETPGEDADDERNLATIRAIERGVAA
ncbi:MAG: deoxyribonuclease IV [Candidatus Eremiobacteraeota bacterium]|nr:deoxyribonuclease IV [Candidatus Eremiobacteraeota bacterium]